MVLIVVLEPETKPRSIGPSKSGFSSMIPPHHIYAPKEPCLSRNVSERILGENPGRAKELPENIDAS
jgi:hypothetical protein